MSKQLAGAHEHGNCCLCDDLERQLAKAQKTIEKLQRGVRCKQPNCPNPKADRGYCHHHRYLKWD